MIQVVSRSAQARITARKSRSATMSKRSERTVLARLFETIEPVERKDAPLLRLDPEQLARLPALRHREDADRIGPEENVRRQLEFARTGFHGPMVKRRSRAVKTRANSRDPRAAFAWVERARTRPKALRRKSAKIVRLGADAREHLSPLSIEVAARISERATMTKHNRNDPGVRDHRAACSCIRGWKRRLDRRRRRRRRRSRRWRAGRRGRRRHGGRHRRRRSERAGPPRSWSSRRSRPAPSSRATPAPRRRRTTPVTAAPIQTSNCP